MLGRRVDIVGIRAHRARASQYAPGKPCGPDATLTIAPPLSQLELADALPASRIDWIATGAKVPAEVTAGH